MHIGFVYVMRTQVYFPPDSGEVAELTNFPLKGPRLPMQKQLKRREMFMTTGQVSAPQRDLAFRCVGDQSV